MGEKIVGGAASAADHGQSHADATGDGHDHHGAAQDSAHDHGDHDHHDGHHDHGHDHGHGHDHHHGLGGHNHAPTTFKPLAAALIFTATIFIAEAIAGWLSGSLSLVADAAHTLSDSAGLLMALAAAAFGARKPDPSATFGYRRAEVLAAFLNAVAVIIASVWIVVEAVRRVGSSTEINTTLMLIVAFIGLIANLASVAALHRHHEDSMNVAGAYLHVLSDVFGSLAVIVAGLVIRYTGFEIADVIASLIIAVLIAPRAYKLAKQAARVLLEQTPSDISIDDLRADLEKLDGVSAVHDLHIWSTDGEEALGSCHLVVEGDADRLLGENCGSGVLDRASDVFAAHRIEHCTLQIERAEHAGHERSVHA